MKSLFSVFKSKQKDSGHEFDDGIVVENDENQSNNSRYEYKPAAAAEEEKNIAQTQSANQTYEQSYNETYDNDIDLQDFVEKAQAYLNSGSKALADAEAKTEELESMDPNSLDYDELVEEVRSLQAKAGYDFKQAQTLIKTANSLKEQEAAEAN